MPCSDIVGLYFMIFEPDKFFDNNSMLYQGKHKQLYNCLNVVTQMTTFKMKISTYHKRSINVWQVKQH